MRPEFNKRDLCLIILRTSAQRYNAKVTILKTVPGRASLEIQIKKVYF
jgi:hypothetical protein